MIWFVYALLLPILAGAVMRLVQPFLGERTSRALAVISMALAAAFIAFMPSSGWVLRARYHLLSDTRPYLRLSTDGLAVVTSLAILLGSAWAELAHPKDSAAGGWCD